MNEVQTLKDAIKLAEKRLAEIEKPRYPDGTLGYLWDGIAHKNKLASLINTVDTDNPYSGTTIDGGYKYFSYKNFTPLETAILGMRYENTGVYPGHGKDLVMVIFNTGIEGAGTAGGFLWASRKHETSDLCIKYYYIIKRFEG